MINNQPLVSVIMAVYNAEEYLKRSIDSILNQTYQNLEFIIINDGSTDNSLEIIKRYVSRDKRIVLINQDNIGLTKSLNKAINLAKGKFIARQDADDESISHRIEKQYNILIKNNLELVTARAFKNNKIIPNKIILKFNRVEVFKTGNIFIHGTFFANARIFKQIMYDENYKYAQDFKFILDCFKRDIRIGYIEKPLYLLNDNKKSISNMKKDKQNCFTLLAIIEYFGSGGYFQFLNKFNGKLKKILRLACVIYLQIISKKSVFKVIK